MFDQEILVWTLDLSFQILLLRSCKTGVTHLHLVLGSLVIAL